MKTIIFAFFILFAGNLPGEQVTCTLMLSNRVENDALKVYINQTAYFSDLELRLNETIKQDIQLERGLIEIVITNSDESFTNSFSFLLEDSSQIRIGYRKNAQGKIITTIHIAREE